MFQFVKHFALGLRRGGGSTVGVVEPAPVFLPYVAPFLTKDEIAKATTIEFEVPLEHQRLVRAPDTEQIEAEHETVAQFDRFLKARRLHDAYDVAEGIHARDGDTVDALTLMAESCWELRQTSLAKDFLARAEAAGADSARFHKVSAKSYRGRSDQAAALTHAKRAFEIDPDDVDIGIGLALAYLLSGSQKLALQTLDALPTTLATTTDVMRARSLVSSFFKPERLDNTLFQYPANAALSFERRPLTVDYPFTVQDIELTNHCPMKCVMCPRTHHMTRQLGHMSFETFKNVIDQWAAVDPTFGGTDVVWLHHYGESLVHPEFDKFIKYGRAAGVPVGLSINPLILTAPLAERLLAAAPHTLWMALDGHDDKSFEAVRGIPRAYEKSKINALRFAKMKAESGVDTHLEVIMINFPDNEQSITEVTEFWSGVAGVDKFQPKPFTTWDGSAEEINRLNPSAGKMNAKRACNFPWSKLSILYTGDVVACCYDYDGKYVLGNVNTSTLADIWNGPRLKHLRASLTSGIVLNKMCQNCENMCSH